MATELEGITDLTKHFERARRHPAFSSPVGFLVDRVDRLAARILSQQSGYLMSELYYKLYETILLDLLDADMEAARHDSSVMRPLPIMLSFSATHPLEPVRCLFTLASADEMHEYSWLG